MKAFKILSFFFLLLAIIIIVGSFFLPSTFKYSYTGKVNAAPDKVFLQINELKNWQNWSYWNRMDTAMQVTYSTPSAGKNAYYIWTSKNKDVGSGKLTIVNSVLDSIVDTHLEFDEWGGGEATYILKPTNTGTELTLTFQSEMKGVFYKWIGLLVMRSQMKTAYTSCVEELDKFLNQ